MIEDNIAALDVVSIGNDLDARGYAVVEGLVDDADIDALVEGFDDDVRYRKTVVMERYRFGRGTYRYYAHPLPDVVQTMRTQLYDALVPIANAWMQKLGLEATFPSTLAALHEQCAQRLQTLPTALILRYGKGDFNTLHQDLYGDVWFPLQAVIFASEPDVDHTGGEFVLTEQTPRAQSKAIVLRPKKGDVVVMATSFRPALSTKGWMRLTMRHGVSEVKSGQRHAVGIIFHDAIS